MLNLNDKNQQQNSYGYMKLFIFKLFSIKMGEIKSVILLFVLIYMYYMILSIIILDRSFQQHLGTFF